MSKLKLQNPTNETYELMHKGLDDFELRRSLAKKFVGFCLIYLPHYFTLPKADFHDDLIGTLDDWSLQFLAIEGFRGSAKSSLTTLAFILYMALEHPNIAPFIIPVNETSDVAKLTVANLREELEQNALIQADYGKLIVDKGMRTAFSETNILLANGVRIMARSRGQKIRGLRHKQHRPSLVIGDDVEELEKVQKKEYRDKTENWIKNNIIPAIEEGRGRLILIGNMLHTDALMARLKKHSLFTHRSYSIFKGGEDWEHCTWKGKYATPESLKRQEQKVGRTTWLREYCLKVVPPEGQEVKEEWIRYYKEMPTVGREVSGTGVDLAISKKETADFTAMVTGSVVMENETFKIYIHPEPVNEHYSLHDTIQQSKAIMAMEVFHRFFVEDVGYQKAATEEMVRNGINATPMRAGSDKRARLRTIAPYIQNGVVVFPETGCEDLLAQILGFGVEEHDDLMDAFVYLILGLVNAGLERPQVYAI